MQTHTISLKEQQQFNFFITHLHIMELHEGRYGVVMNKMHVLAVYDLHAGRMKGDDGEYESEDRKIITVYSCVMYGDCRQRLRRQK